MKNSVLFYSKSSLGFALIALLSFGSIFSISADEDEDSAEVAEEIVVTGSRIKRADNISSPTPMVTLGEDQIENTGSVNVYDILNELPQAGEALSRGNTNFTVGSSGVQTVNLRGLGNGRTLTLVNGRRWVGGQPGTGIVDLNSIPTDLIERLEVITGGASSVYGSDAIAGVVNIICGEPAIVATTLSKSKIPRLITMIGSTSTAKKVYADSSTSIKRLSMELGGNAPFIVFDDADLDAAIDLAIGIKFGNSGQICVAANRFFIHDKIYDTFLKHYLERVKKLKLGFGEDSSPDMGPLITVKSRDRILDLISDSIKNGAKLEYGGKIPENFSDGNWLEPTVITHVSQDMRIFNEEIFGPVASIIKFSNDNEVLKLANSTDYGLASYIFTNNKKRIDFFSENLNFGEVQVNGIKYAIYLPHGGIKESGIGHDCSHLALYDYLTKKRISVAL